MRGVVFHWDGKVMTPQARFARVCEEQFVPGRSYLLEERKKRSRKEHNLFFACVAETFENLPEAWGGHFRNEDHLRKWALIHAGFANEHQYEATSPEQAAEIAHFMAELLVDDFVKIIIDGRVVSILTAKSQSEAAMGAAVFRDSMDKVLDVCARLLDITVEQLVSNVKSASPAARSAA